jgi:hypothetical protein
MTDARFVALSAPLLSLISLVLCACYAAHMAAIEPLHPPSDSAVVVIIVLFLSCLAQWYLCKVGMRRYFKTVKACHRSFEFHYEI